MTTTDSAPDTLQLAGTRWELDPAGSRAEFRVPNVWGLASVKGRFEQLDGRLEVGADGRWQLELTLEAAGIDTGNHRRDRHLRSADFLGVDRHPEIRFRSTRVEDRGGGRLRVEGELQAAGGRVRPAVDVTVTRAAGRLELDASATVDQRGLGMTWSPLGVIRAPTAVHVHAHLRPARGAS